MKWVLIWVIFQGPNPYDDPNSGRMDFTGKKAQTECAFELAKRDQHLRELSTEDPSLSYMVFCQDIKEIKR